jgi:putative transposase
VLGQVCSRFNWRCHAYCEMTNHYHFVVEAPEANLSKGMRQLNGVYTQQFNGAMDWWDTCFRAGPRPSWSSATPTCWSWRATWCSIRCERVWFLHPRHGHGAAIRRWSGWTWPLHGWKPIGCLGSSAPSAGRRKKAMRALWPKASAAKRASGEVFVGSDRFIERFALAARPVERPREVLRAQRRPLARPLGHYECTYPDRCEAMARAFLTGVYTMQEIAERFGVHYSTVSRAVRSLEAS